MNNSFSSTELIENGAIGGNYLERGEWYFCFSAFASSASVYSGTYYTLLSYNAIQISRITDVDISYFDKYLTLRQKRHDSDLYIKHNNPFAIDLANQLREFKELENIKSLLKELKVTHENKADIVKLLVQQNIIDLNHLLLKH